MKRVLVDARIISKKTTGIGRYSEALMTAISDLDPKYISGFEFFSYRDPSSIAPIGKFKTIIGEVKVGGSRDYFRGSSALSRALNDLDADLYHNFFHLTPRKKTKAIPTILTLHDTIWIDHAIACSPNRVSAFTQRAFAKIAIPDSLRKADHVICVSHATAERAKEWIPEDKISVIGHGVDNAFFESFKENDLVKRYTTKGRSYVVAIGNDKAYKNIDLLIESFDDLNDPKLNLVLVGNCAAFAKKVAKLSSARRIFLAGMLDDDALKNVLAHASLFVFPSLVEGFGLPVLEAMAAGVATLVSDLEPMRSVAGGAGLLFNPYSIQDLAGKMKRALKSEENARLSTLGRAHAQKQTWKKAAEETIEVYQKVLSNV